MTARKDETREEYLERRKPYNAARYAAIRHLILPQRRASHISQARLRILTCTVCAAPFQVLGRGRFAFCEAHHPESRRAYQRLWERKHYWANLDESRAIKRKKMRKYNARNKRVGLAGERVRLADLPDELRPIARLIYETRQEIKHKRGTTR